MTLWTSLCCCWLLYLTSFPQIKLIATSSRITQRLLTLGSGCNTKCCRDATWWWQKWSDEVHRGYLPRKGNAWFDCNTTHTHTHTHTHTVVPYSMTVFTRAGGRLQKWSRTGQSDIPWNVGRTVRHSRTLWVYRCRTEVGQKSDGSRTDRRTIFLIYGKIFSYG